MNSTLKTALPIILVFLMVFGITFMSQFTAPAPVAVDQSEEDTAPPLVVGNAEIKFDPNPAAPPHDRFFPGNFEVGTEGNTNRVGFFVRNVRSSSVFLTALAPSCTACTSARAAAIPPELLKDYIQKSVIGSFGSPYPTGNLLSAITWTQVRHQLAWHDFVFKDVRNKFELPGASPGHGESWGLIELGFKMASAGPPLPKHAAFDVYDAKGQKLSAQPFPFTVVVGGREPQEVNITDYSIPELTETVDSHPFEILCVSATRTDLPPPSVSVDGQDPHIQLQEPIRLTSADLELVSRIASAMPQSNNTPPNSSSFRSGYRIRGKILRDANGRTLDMGPYEKFIFVGAGPGIVVSKPTRVRFHGLVSGAIHLEGSNKIEFGSYNGDYVQKKEIRIWTERKNIELDVVSDLCSPSFIKPTLSKPSVEAGRTYWTLTVTIPAKAGKSPPWEGFVYLRSKGESPLNIRIQTSGHGR